MSTDAPPQASTPSTPAPPARRDRLRPALRATALIAGVVAVVGALVLPFAPVVANAPQVRWPVDPSAPTPTMLMLTAYEPLTFEARISCRVARAAEATPDGLVLATMAPGTADLDTRGLDIRARGGALTMRSSGEDLFAGPLPPGDCSYVVRGDARAMTVTLDGSVVATAETYLPEGDPDVRPESRPDPKPITPLPEVDALTSSVTAVPAAGPDDLAVDITVDDSFGTVPAPAKSALIAVLLVALGVGALAALGLAARPPPGGASVRDRALRAGRRARRLRPRVVDVVVPVVLVAWTFLAPRTDDDGYYSAMAANVPFSGYVPNYYQLYDQGFTPFSWPYYALSWWQETFGVAPVVLRVPALLLGLGTWALARAFVARARLGAGGTATSRWTCVATRAVLAAAFLAWWLPYDMGVRPEPVTAFFTVAALVAVAEGVERRRLVPVALGVGLSSIGLMTAPTGFIALAPVVAAAPAIWRMVRERSRSWGAVAGRWVLVLAPAAAGSLSAFADGSYGDFARAQEIFAPIQRAQTWYAELDRYAQLLGTGTHFGSYARRAAVLAALLGLVWFLVLVVAARARDLAVPSRLLLAGWSTGLALVLLLPTPSKPTHHFGAFAGLGAAFLALMLVAGPRLARELLDGRRPPVPVLVAAAASAVLVAALAGHGRNLWPFGWGLGMPTYGDFPAAAGLRFDQPLWWAVVLAVLAAVLGVAVRRVPRWRRRALVIATPATVAVLLVATTAWMVDDVARAAANTSTTYSPQADALADPFATRCGAAQQVDVLDEAATRTTPRALLPGEVPAPPIPAVGAPDAPDARPEPFVPGAWLPNSPPPVELPPGLEAWGSFLVPGPGADADARTGTFTTGWYQVPVAGDAALVVFAAGRRGDGNTLRAEYGRRTGAGFVPVTTRDVGDDANASDWRAIPLVGEDDRPPPGTDAVRLVATDDSTSTGGWLAFTAPVERSWVPLQRYLPATGAVGVAWQLKSLFPCIRQPRQQGGITEPAVAAVGYGSTPEAALRDWTFDPRRGGLLGHARREATPTALTTRFRDFPDEVDDVQVFDLRQPFPADDYRLTPGSRPVSGLG